MPIKRRLTKSYSPYMHYDQQSGQIVYRTPASCTNWPIELRLRLIRDYIEPDTVMRHVEFNDRFVTTGKVDAVYRIEKRQVRILHPYTVEKHELVRIDGTDLLDVNLDKVLRIRHKEPAVRILTAYSFVTGDVIPGLSPLDVYDYTTRTS